MRRFLAVCVLFLAAQTVSAGPFKAEFPIASSPLQTMVPVAGVTHLSVENLLGDIRVYPVEGDAMVLNVDGLRYAEGALLRVWETQPGKIVVKIVYPPITVIPPVGQIIDNYPVSEPALGVHVKNGTVVLAGLSYTRGRVFSIGTPGVLRINGHVGETHLSVGIPASLSPDGVKLSCGVGDITVDTLRPVFAETSAGKILPEAIACSVNIADAGDRFQFENTPWK